MKQESTLNCITFVGFSKLKTRELSLLNRRVAFVIDANMNISPLTTGENPSVTMWMIKYDVSEFLS